MDSEYDDFDPDDIDPEWYEEEEPDVEPLVLQPGVVIKYKQANWTVLGHYMWDGNPTYFIANASGKQLEGWWHGSKEGGYFAPV